MKKQDALWSVSVICLIILSVLWASSCSNNQDISKKWEGQIKSEDGIKVIKNPEEPLYGEIQFDLEEDLIIGNKDEEYAPFYKGLRICVGPMGRCYVLNMGESLIQVFDSDGKFLFSFGGQGQGPGELEHPGSLHLDDEGNVYVYQTGRISIFNEGGEFIRSIPLSHYLRSWGIAADKSIIGVSIPAARSDQYIYRLLKIAEDGISVQTLAEFPFYELEFVNDVYIGANNVFSHDVHYVQLSPEEGIYGYSDRYRLYKIDSEGNLISVIEKNEKPEKITRSDKNSVIDFEISRIQRLQKKTVPREVVKSKYHFPSHKPFFHTMSPFLSDGLGNLYIPKIDYKKKRIYYDFFNKDGIYLYEITFPYKIIPQVIRSGRIYTFETDPNSGFWMVHRYRIKNWDQMKRD